MQKNCLFLKQYTKHCWALFVDGCTRDLFTLTIVWAYQQPMFFFLPMWQDVPQVHPTKSWVLLLNRVCRPCRCQRSKVTKKAESLNKIPIEWNHNYKYILQPLSRTLRRGPFVPETACTDPMHLCIVFCSCRNIFRVDL